MKNLQQTTYDRRLRMLSTYVFVVGCWLSVVGVASAATFVVQVDTGNQTVNAIEGTLLLPPGVLVEEIYTGNTAILLWVVAPAQKTGENSIFFSGVTPGGLYGKKPLFYITNASLSAPQVNFSGVHSYLDDGSGTEAAVRLSIVPAAIAEDTAPPEPFEVVISSSPDLFSGARFASFVTQDKGTGVERYEAAFAWLFSPNEDEWKAVESPLMLSRANLFQTIHIRAVDHSGNMHEISPAGPYRYPSIVIGIILIACVLLFLKRSFYPSFSPPPSLQ